MLKTNGNDNRLLPINESVLKGLELETRINDFNILKELGSGAFGRVYLVEHKKTNVKYAVKALDKRNKSNLDQKAYFQREIEVMYKLNHSNIVKLYGHFEDNIYCYFLMEYIPKGNLYGLMPKDKKKRINTKVIASIIKDIISGLYYLHNMNPPIIHRDIKPENILLGEGLIAKITDFGWSNYIIGGIKRTTMCGTPIYLAPEIIKEEGHNEKVDIWCVGVLLFELVTGSLPFKGSDLDSLKKNILSLNISWPKDINLDAKNLIMKILKLDPDSRISFEDMLQHPFFTKHLKNPLQFLIKPDKEMKHIPYLISIDTPETYIAKLNNKNYNIENNKENTISSNNDKINNNIGNALSLEEKYFEMQEKFEKLKNDIDLMKKGEYPSNEIELDELKNILHVKEERIAELLSLIKKESGEEGESEETYLKIKCDELEKKNIYYKNKVERYEKFIDEHKIEISNIKIDKKLKGLRNSMDENNKENFEVEISNLQIHLDSETEINLNEIIKEKDKEIEKIKEEAKIRRDKEKKKFHSIANKYDKELTMLEKENEDLKKRLKELQG
jgi:aurora kinase